MKIKWQSLLALSLLSFSSLLLAEDNNTQNNNKEVLSLENCHLKGIKSQVQCGTLQVPENYSLPEGEKISVNFAVLPAIDSSQNKTPLMFLAGGPGQASVELAAHIFSTFGEIKKSHDIILVDQRGTGKSHPLSCDENEVRNAYEIIPEDFSPQEIKDCIAQFKGDLSQYNSENAIRDFDAVRVALGHEKINIYGGSYGTRAALVYMRLFPDALNSVVLDSVGPIEVPIGTFGQSSARSFNLLLENCQQDESCNSAYPSLKDDFTAVIARLEQAPVNLKIAHPRLGTKTDFVLSRSKFISNLRMQLYSMQTRTLVPLVIHQAFLGNYQPMIGLIAMSEGGMGMYVGLTLNIVCNEDFPKITTEMFAGDANNTFGGNDSHSAWLQACPLWPKYAVSDDFYQSVTANIPTLILSGNLDPVTPPSNGDESAKTLPNNHHIVSKNSAHIVASTPCGIEIVNEFLTTLDPNDLDESCLAELKSETFMTHLNGNL
ncbi:MULTISPECIES: alpha/beta fold hydrolase [unclassified Colwellia]|uniref:alpha/beta fold hydrolase n=1 Tax=unclassified Colwellia TaxID=196834 RepID=UPI0015F5FFFE|nr:MULTISPECIES: alpha/beta fold hydrolase [unclassified Colwellia]MBA6351721.1 alpha/beta fold hydrolase [Colwellia sp. BRX9-1]MBA6356703.1 alpha/beta fold hydrolase [Colwellia sp. BRX8-3]MBA6359032.1 alpha/beta fold hydrolase [Colwellia sp. BRX8-6]MBA6369248.1 alpha/beta fold hydrolase [Colwellia sp. BRX8-5]MBA6375333.1 alpha/beta fold hydrolase [Colwellia sp. BRX8-2]